MKHYLTTLLSAVMIAGALPCSGEVPRPEHPRPDQLRENWTTLNGEWQFEIDDKADGDSRGLTHGKDLSERIIVPFCPESKLSGLGYGNTRKLKHVCYGKGPQTLDEFYQRYQGTIDAMLDNPNFFGFCYTQLTDIEQEKNGLFYYDRSPKFDNARLKQITSRQAAYEKSAPMAPPSVVKTIDAHWKVLVGAVQDGDLSTSWQYSLEKPAEDWANAGFDDSKWKSGLAPFASSPEKRTEWADGEIRCRKTFEFDGAALKHAALVLRNNGQTDVWLNGEKILSAEATREYQLHLLTEVLRDKLRKGTNTIALHSRKQRNATYLDLAILIDDGSAN